MPKRDYYEILGVSRSATDDEIKSAYRKLARKLHPDVNKAPDAQQKFTEIQHAYDILSDENKRRLYDQYGEAGVSGAAQPGPNARWNSAQPGSQVEFDPDSLNSMFEAFFGGRAGGFGGGFPGGATRSKSGRSKPHRPREPEVVEHDLHISFMTAAQGGTEKVRLTDDSGRTRTIEVKIPPGVYEGASLRVRGGGPSAEDIVFKVRIGSHPVFRRVTGPAEGKPTDLILELPLTIAEASLGATVVIPTLDGSVELKIPPATPSGRKLRLRGRGIKPASGEPGDLFVLTRIVTPDPELLSDPEREVLRAIGRRQPNPRSGDAWPAK